MAEVEHHLHARCRAAHQTVLVQPSAPVEPPVSYLLVSHRRRESQQPSTRMGPLLLLTSTLLFCCGRAEPQLFLIREIVLNIEPNTEVARDTNVTVRCKASIAGSVDSLSRTYTIYRDGIQVYTKTTSSSEDLVYPLNQARVSNSGKYKCEIDIEGRKSTSDPKKLTVTGLSVPVLHINKGVFSEGEEVKATCTAPEENGSIIFYFYADSEEIREERVSVNKAEVSLRFSSPGIRKLRCVYAVLVTPDSFKSKESNNVTLSVKELRITTALEISPEEDIYEGDELSISCTVIDSDYRSTSVNYNLFLVQGDNVLGQTKFNQKGQTKINHTMIVLAKHSGDFECRLDMGNIAKVSTKTVSVTELFSEPTLTMSPAEVFHEDKINLTCKSQHYASERLRREDVTYTILPLESQLRAQREVGVFSGKAPRYNLNYTCTARAKGFLKTSNTLMVRPKVTVSTPRIWVSGNVILGEPFQVLCLSERGSLPIHYSLLRDYEELNRTVTVQQPGQPALFPITIHQPKDITLYMCEARNNPRKESVYSKSLFAPVIVPLSEPWLTVVPDLTNIAEGDRLYLICSVKGTPPVTFKWYRHGNPQVLLFSNITNQNTYDYQVPGVGSQHSGNYFCEASNNANKVHSHMVTIEVLMAMWKKGVIVASCLLVVAVLVLLCVLRFRAKRGKNREAAAELSVKPSSPKSDDSLTVSLTHDREVYNAPTGRVVRSASVWSERPADAANDEESSAASTEPDVEYTEVVHPQPVDLVKVLTVPLKKGTDTVYSELQTSAHGAVDHDDYGAVEYAELNGDQPVNFHAHHPDVDTHQHLPVPVD